MLGCQLKSVLNILLKNESNSILPVITLYIDFLFIYSRVTSKVISECDKVISSWTLDF